MAARELGPLAVFAGELVTDAVEELDVALLRVLLEGGDEGPRHGTGCLGSNGCVGSDDELAGVSVMWEPKIAQKEMRLSSMGEAIAEKSSP